jgi:multicomponent Na+:H+ antiporter subunit D
VLPLFIIVPLVVLLVLNLPAGFLRKLAGPACLLLALAQVAGTIAWWMIAGSAVGAGTSPAFGIAASPAGPLDFFKFHFAVDGLGLVMLLTIGLVMGTSVVVGQATIAEARRRLNFFMLLLVAMVGMNGTVLLSDMFSLYVFLEVTAVASFVLIALERGMSSLEGAFKYLIMSAVASAMMLASVAMLLLFADGTSFKQIADAINGHHNELFVKLAVGVFTCGLFIKGGLVPFHGWLPAAYSTAPAAVSVLLAGIVTKVSGVYALIRLGTSVFAGNPSVGASMMVIGVISIVVGALAAIRQGDFKRMLAYSSISQVGYIILALGCGLASPAGSIAAKLALAGAVFHLFNHATFKSLLFVNSAALEQRLGTTALASMNGLGGRMPVTSVTSVIAVLSTAGVPPLSGFWSKLIIVIALWQGQFYGYAAAAILASVLTLGYFLIMQRNVFFGEVKPEFEAVKEGGLGLTAPAVVLAGIIVLVGALLPWVLNTFLLPVGSIIGK